MLLLDEPLSMLDPEARQSLVATLCGIRRETRTVTLHVTHHAEEAQPVASACAMMRAGRIVAQEPAESPLCTDGSLASRKGNRDGKDRTGMTAWIGQALATLEA